MPKGVFVNDFHPRSCYLLVKLARTWQAPTRKNVLLDKVRRVDVAVKEGIVNHDTLDASMAAGLE